MLDIDVFVDRDELTGNDLLDKSLLDIEALLKLAHLSFDIDFTGLALTYLDVVWVQVRDADLASGLAGTVIAAMELRLILVVILSKRIAVLPRRVVVKLD